MRTLLMTTPNRIRSLIPYRFAALVVMIGTAAAIQAAAPTVDLECFSEPYRVIEIAAPEMGVLVEIPVAEGDSVDQHQMLARLNDRVLEKSLHVSLAAKNASGSLNAALSELRTSQNQLEGYRNLRKNMNATDREMERATTAVAIAQAKVQIVKDENEVRCSEYERAKAQLERRRIKSPLGGIVVEIRKDVGEFVSPSDPVIMTIVDLSQLRARFSVPQYHAKQLRVGQVAKLVLDGDMLCSGIVEFISPITDPQGGTVRVKLRIRNANNALPSGVLCQWDGTAVDAEPQLSQSGLGLRH